MKRSEVYRDAAERVALNDDYPWPAFSCLAIKDKALRKAYDALFSPDETDRHPDCESRYAWGDHWDWPGMAEVRNCRVLALCFMAAIAESEEAS